MSSSSSPIAWCRRPTTAPSRPCGHRKSSSRSPTVSAPAGDPSSSLMSAPWWRPDGASASPPSKPSGEPWTANRSSPADSSSAPPPPPHAPSCHRLLVPTQHPTRKAPLCHHPGWAITRKRHIAVDTSGFLLGVVVHAANIQDADSVWDLLSRIKPLYCWLKAVFADSIYNRLSV